MPSGLILSFAQASPFKQTTISAALVCIILYTAWYLYRFTIYPAWKPKEPQYLSYRIPFIGHAIDLVRNQKALFRHGWVKYCARPFALKAAGKTLYIVSDLSDINAVYRAGDAISFEHATRQTMLLWGISVEGDLSMYREGHQGKFPNPTGKSIGKLAHDIMRAQLESPSGLKQLAVDFQDRLEPLLDSTCALPRSAVLRSNKSNGSSDVSLLRLCQQSLVQAGCDTFFGETLRHLHKQEFVSTFTTFDDNAWKIFSQFPKFTAPKCFVARDEMITAMSRYLDTPRCQRDTASTLIMDQEDEMRAAGMSSRDIALLFFFLNWLFNVNTYKLAFWMTSWIVSDPRLQTTITTELLAGSDKGETPSIEHLVNSCPTLNAVFDEAQRMTVAALSTRVVLRDTVINGWQYRAGGTILVPYQHLHAQRHVFGDNLDEFDHTRFLNGKNLGKNPNFKPFGGGNTLCTGRFLARREVLIFIAMLFTKYNVERVSTSFPQMDITKPSLGTMEAKAGEDMIVNLRAR